MNSIEKLRWRVQIALLIEAHKNGGSVPDVVELAKRYHIVGDPVHVASAITRWEDSGYLITYRTLDGVVGARIKPQALANALSEVLDVLEADTFQIDWKKEEIVTDADNDELIATPTGWKLYKIEKEKILPTVGLINQTTNPSISIVNNFSPTNHVNQDVGRNPLGGISWAGWVGVIISIIAILVTLWLADKI